MTEEPQPAADEQPPVAVDGPAETVARPDGQRDGDAKAEQPEAAPAAGLPVRMTRAQWLALWAAAIVGVIVVFVILVAITNP